MNAQILPASRAEGHRPPIAGHERFTRVPTRVGTNHESPVTSFNLFRFTLLSKNAPANHLVSHSCKNKGLKVPCFHTLTKNIGGRGRCVVCESRFHREGGRITRPRRSNFRLSTVNSRLFRSNSFRLTYIHKNAPANPYGSHTSKTKDLKSRRITYLQKKGGVAGGSRISCFDFRVSSPDLRLSTVDSRLHQLC